MVPHLGRAWWLVGAYATLLASIGLGLTYGDRLDRRLAEVAGQLIWLLLPFGLLLCLAVHHRIGAGLDAYNAEYLAHRQHLDGVTQAVAVGVFLTGLRATLTIVGLFFGIVGLVWTLQ